MIVLNMAGNLGVSVLLVLRVFRLPYYYFVSVMKQHILDANSLQFVCIKTDLSFTNHQNLIIMDMFVCFIGIEAKI